METQDAIRFRALYNVLHPDYHYSIRYIIRWYSRTFSTPIAQVMELPLDEVLLHYYECHYEEMDETQVQFEIDHLLESEEIRASKIREEEAREVEDVQFQRQVEGEEASAQEEKNVKANSEPQPPLPRLDAPIPPDMSVKFLDPNLFEEALDGFGIMPPPVRKK